MLAPLPLHRGCQTAGVPSGASPWQEQLPDGVRHAYAAVARQWPGLEAHLTDEVIAYACPDAAPPASAADTQDPPAA